MTTDIDLAKQNGIAYYLTPEGTTEMHCTDRQIQAFADAVRLAERERLAQADKMISSLRVRNADLLSALESLLSAVQASGMDAYGTVTEDSEMAIRKATAP